MQEQCRSNCYGVLILSCKSKWFFCKNVGRPYESLTEVRAKTRNNIIETQELNALSAGLPFLLIRCAWLLASNSRRNSYILPSSLLRSYIFFQRILYFLFFFLIHIRYNTLVRAYARFYDTLLFPYTYAFSRRSECYKGTELYNYIYEKNVYILKLYLLFNKLLSPFYNFF